MAEDPPLKGRPDGYHMRMIIGFNEKAGTWIFTDSWGRGHEFKTVDAEEEAKVTTGLDVLKPTTH